MEFFKTDRITASIEPDGLVIRHIAGGCVTIPIARFERWLLKCFRGAI